MSNCGFPNWLDNTQRRLVRIAKDGDDEFLTLSAESEIIVMGEMRTTQLFGVDWSKITRHMHHE